MNYSLWDMWWAEAISVKFHYRTDMSFIKRGSCSSPNAVSGHERLDRARNIQLGGWNIGSMRQKEEFHGTHGVNQEPSKRAC